MERIWKSKGGEVGISKGAAMPALFSFFPTVLSVLSLFCYQIRKEEGKRKRKRKKGKEKDTVYSTLKYPAKGTHAHT